MCRYAVLFQRRPSEIARWPAWELDLLDHFLAREPSPMDRIEIAVARLTATYKNAHLEEGQPQKGVADFMPYRTVWDPLMSDEEVEQTLRALE